MIWITVIALALVAVMGAVCAGLCAVIAADRQIISALMREKGADLSGKKPFTGVISPYKPRKPNEKSDGDIV